MKVAVKAEEVGLDVFAMGEHHNAPFVWHGSIRTPEIALAEGLDAVTARRVATAAGISPGLVFFHFQSKDGLLQALLDVLLDGTRDALSDPDLTRLAPWDRLERMIRVELERLVEYPAAVELIFAFYFSRRDDLFRSRIERSFRHYLDAFSPVCRELATATGVPGDELAATVVALVQGASIQAIRSPGSFSPEAILATLRALRPTPSKVEDRARGRQ